MSDQLRAAAERLSTEGQKMPPGDPTDWGFSQDAADWREYCKSNLFKDALLADAYLAEHPLASLATS
jgi:hypothetical protein